MGKVGLGLSYINTQEEEEDEEEEEEEEEEKKKDEECLFIVDKINITITLILSAIDRNK